MTISQPDSAENSVKIDVDPPSIIMEADVEASEASDVCPSDAEYTYEEEEEEYVPHHKTPHRTIIPNSIYNINEYLHPSNTSKTCLML